MVERPLQRHPEATRFRDVLDCAGPWLSEYLAGSRGLGIPDAFALPAVVASAAVRLQRTLDLTSSATVSALGLDLGRFLANGWREENEVGRESEPQAFGAAARSLGIEALRVPSVADLAVANLVVFVDRLGPGSSVNARGWDAP